MCAPCIKACAPCIKAFKDCQAECSKIFTGIQLCAGLIGICDKCPKLCAPLGWVFCCCCCTTEPVEVQPVVQPTFNFQQESAASQSQALGAWKMHLERLIEDYSVRLPARIRGIGRGWGCFGVAVC